MKLKSALFGLLVLSQIVIIAFYIRIFFASKHKLQIIPISQENILSATSDHLFHFYESSPSSVISYKPTWSPNPIRHTITKDTLNERYEYSLEKPHNTKRIITLGDSFTYGLFVNTEETWSEYLEDLLNKNIPCPNIAKYEVINFGMTGYDARYSAVRFKERGMQYNPDTIIWYIKDDDIEEIRDITYSIIKEYVIQQRMFPINSSKSDVELYEQGYYEAQKDLMKQYSQSDIYLYHTQSFSLVTSIFDGALYVINGFDYSGNSEKFLQNIQQTSHTIKIFDKLLSEFSLKSVTNTPYDFHLNSLGHRIIAEKLYFRLVEDNFCAN
jgi:hypothetical protein